MTAIAAPVRDRPLLMSGPMVRAALGGRKTQTRRVVKGGDDLIDLGKPDATNIRVVDGGIRCDWRGGTFSIPKPCPYGQPGDRLWARENFRGPGHIGDGDQGVIGWGVEYAADDAFKLTGDCGCEGPCSGVRIVHKLRPSIHMPRDYSRLTLEITEVRVERLQEISEADANAEGVEPTTVGTTQHGLRHRPAYRELWDSLNAKRGYGWDVNPWIWVVTFEVAP